MREVLIYSVLLGLSSACLSGFGGGSSCCSAPTASCGNPCGGYASGGAPPVDRYPLAPPSPLSVPLPGPIQNIPSNAYAVAPQEQAPVNPGGLFQDPTSFFNRPMPVIPMPSQIQPIPLYGHPTNEANNNYAPPTQQFVPASQNQNIQAEQIYRGSGGYSTGPATAVEQSNIGYKNAGSATAVVVEGQYKDTPSVTNVAEPSQTVVKVGTEIDTTVGGSDYSDVLEHKKQIQVIHEIEKKVKENYKPIRKPDVDENPDAGSSIDSTDGGSDYDQVEEGEVAGNDEPNVAHGSQQKVPTGGSSHSVPTKVHTTATEQVVPSGPVPQPTPAIVSKHVAPVHKLTFHGESRQIPDDGEDKEQEVIDPRPAVVKTLKPTAGGLDFKEVQHDLTTEKPRSTIPGKPTQPTTTAAPSSSDIEEASPEQPETPSGGTEIHTTNTVIQPSRPAPVQVSHSDEEQGEGTDYDNENEASVGPSAKSNDVTSSGSSSSSSSGKSQIPSESSSDSSSGATGPVQIPLTPAKEVTEEADEAEQSLTSNEAEDISIPNTGSGVPTSISEVPRVSPNQATDEEDALAEAISSEATGHPTTPGVTNTGSNSHPTPSVAVPAHQNDKIRIDETPLPITPTKPAEPSVVPHDVSEETDGSDYDSVPEKENNVPTVHVEVPSHDERENHGETITTVEDSNHSETGFNPAQNGPAKVTGSNSHPTSSVAVPAHQNHKIRIDETPLPITPTKPAEPSVVPHDVSEETDGSDYDSVPEDRPDVPTHPTLPSSVRTPSSGGGATSQKENHVPTVHVEVPSHDERENHGETVTTVEDSNHSERGFNPAQNGPAKVPVAPAVSAPKIAVSVGVPTPSKPSVPALANSGMIPIQPQPLAVSHEVLPSPSHKKDDDNQEIVEPQETQGTDYSDGAEYDDVKPNAVEHTPVIVNSEDEKKENRNELAVEYNGQRAAGTVQLTEVNPISKYTDELISLRKLKRSQRA